MSVNPVPERHRSVNAHLIVDDAAKALDAYAKAFGADDLYRLPMGDEIGHAELRIGGTS